MKLIEKYNVPAPRYTSYPTVPQWENNVDTVQWEVLVKNTFNTSLDNRAISLYIHLPFCESLCTYCGCNTRITVNHEIERPYLDVVLKEWAMYCNLFKNKPRIREIHLGGGTPTFFSAENLEYLICGLLSNSMVCDDAEFSFEAHPNNTTVQHLEMLRNMGFTRLSVGVQDFNPKVQHIINRIQSFEQTRKVIDNARSLEYSSVSIDLVYGLPLQTPHSITDTVNKVIQLKPDRIAFYSYAHVPWLKPGQRKFTEADLPNAVVKRQLYELGRSMLLAAGYYEIGMDHFAMPHDSLYKAVQNKTLHRNFMGYTDHYTHSLIGLGASSISDMGIAFAQNEKKVEDYMALIKNTIFPIKKGHLHTIEDYVLRKHIMNIICRFKTNLLSINDHPKVIKDVVSRLEEMEKDGLVKLDAEYVYVTEKGKPFLRNICMAFDARFWNNKTDVQIYSKAV